MYEFAIFIMKPPKYPEYDWFAFPERLNVILTIDKFDDINWVVITEALLLLILYATDIVVEVIFIFPPVI